MKKYKVIAKTSSEKYGNSVSFYKEDGKFRYLYPEWKKEPSLSKK